MDGFWRTYAWLAERFGEAVAWLVVQGADEAAAQAGLALAFLVLATVVLVHLWRLLTWPWRKVPRHSKRKPVGRVPQEPGEDIERSGPAVVSQSSRQEIENDTYAAVVPLIAEAMAARESGDNEAAEDFYRRALAILEPTDKKDDIAGVLSELGSLARQRGDIGKAEDFFRRSLALVEGQADTYAALGTIAFERREIDPAEELFRRSLSIAEQLGNKRGQAVALHNLGEVAAGGRGDFGAAIDLFKRALALNEQIGSKLGQAHNLGMLGNVARARGDLDDAADFHKRALTLNEQIGSKTGQAAELFNLGLVAEERGEQPQQCSLWARSRDLYRQAGIAHEVEDVERRMLTAGCSGTGVPATPGSRKELRAGLPPRRIAGTKGEPWSASSDEDADEMGYIDGLRRNPLNPPREPQYRAAYEYGYQEASDDM